MTAQGRGSVAWPARFVHHTALILILQMSKWRHSRMKASREIRVVAWAWWGWHCSSYRLLCPKCGLCSGDSESHKISWPHKQADLPDQLTSQISWPPKQADLTNQLTSQTSWLHKSADLQTSSANWRSDGENNSLGLQSGIAYEVKEIFTAKWQNGVQFLGSLDLFSLFD